MDISREEYFRKVLKLGEKRKSKITNSYNVIDAYRYLYRIGYFKNNNMVKEKFYSIWSRITKYMSEGLAKGEEYKFPFGMGSISLRKGKSRVFIKDNNKLAYRYKEIDWNTTLNLWYDDEETRQKKILVRYEKKYGYRIFYSKYDATCHNLLYYQFRTMDSLKCKIDKQVSEEDLDLFMIH